ncbi:MAG: glycine--tRNA ligase subunit beta [Nitrospirota bacterium]
MSLPFLLEIGTEEIPDWMIVPALNSLQDMFQTLLDQQGLGGLVKSVDATPRRLVLRADELKARQADTEEVVLGPPKSAGPGAAVGFAKKMGVTADALGLQTTAKGEYLSYRKLIEGRETSTILCESLPGLILKIYFPKSMYWNGKGSERFIRPIRWVVSILGYDVVPFEVAGVKAHNVTRGHRLLGAQSIEVGIGSYEEELEANGVMVSAADRRARIEEIIAPWRVKHDPALLETLVYITEYPTPILGSFDEQYLELPPEILSTVMRHHQKYFSVEREDGSLAPNFVAVMNTNADPEGLVKRGHERVLRARFNDARFFWEVDRRRPLEDRLEDLKHVTFQAKLGSYFDKTNRIVGQTVSESARRAALLCKCDLTTDMVKEFTDLQGIMGGLYAKAQGEPEEVWRAIYDHYKPLSMEGDIPSTETGRELALADKWDTLKSCFHVGLIPTGSKDPFALRRAAQGVVRILVEGKMPVQIVIENDQLREFMRDRVEYYFREVRGHQYDEVRACLAAGWDNLLDLDARLKRVRVMRATPDFEPLAASFKRIKNILKQADFTGGHSVREDLLEPGPERDLHEAIERTNGQPLESRIAMLRPKVDLFFDKVLVNDKDEAVRRNRLTLLHNLLAEFSTIADFSEIVSINPT